jgi:hypothetical protein
MKRLWLRLAVLVVFLLFLAVVAPEFMDVRVAAMTLLFGWRPSLVRLFGAWHPGRGGGVWLFVFAAAVLVAGSHAFLRWLYASLRNPNDSRWPAAWRWKWTLGGFAMLGCTLLAICSVVLTTHQIYWISKSSDPLFAHPDREGLGVDSVAKELQTKAEELQWNSVKTQDSFRRNEFTGSGLPAAETIQPVWVEKEVHSLRAIILIPRRPLFRAKARVAVLQPGTNFACKLEELPQVLASFGMGSARQVFSQGTPPRP